MGFFCNAGVTRHLPAELLDGAYVNDSVMEVVHKLWHVFVQEALVCVNRVTCTENTHKFYIMIIIKMCIATKTHQPEDTVRAACAV